MYLIAKLNTIIKLAQFRNEEYVNYKSNTFQQKTSPDEIKCVCATKLPRSHKLVTKEVPSEICNNFYAVESKINFCNYKTFWGQIWLLMMIMTIFITFKTKIIWTIIALICIGSMCVQRLRVSKNILIRIHGILTHQINSICPFLLQSQTPADLRKKIRSRIVANL